MHTAAYEDILRATALAVGLAPDNLSAGSGGDFANLRTLHSLCLNVAWTYQEWAELCPLERRFFRDSYNSGSGYTAGQEVFYIGPRSYYQALTTVPSGQAPATLSGSTWSTNLQYWAVLEPSYSAAEYDNAAAYVRGERVFYTPTQTYYQLHAATSTGNLPTADTHWGPLIEFVRYVPWEQPGQTAFDLAFRAWDKDPRKDGSAKPLDTDLGPEGLLVFDRVPWAFVKLRRRAPRLTGSVWSASQIYVAGDQVYFRSAPSIRGNFYDCLATTAAGESPQTDPDLWSQVELPAAFELYLTHAATAAYLNAEEPERAATERSNARNELERLALTLFGQGAGRLRTSTRSR